MTAPRRDWDARTYNRIADPHLDWGAAVLERLALGGAETVLDAGCGTGRVTRLLLERLPRGRVYGVDRSPAMLTVAREELGDAGGRLTLVEADLTRVQLPEPVDGVFSNATFHWIFDQDALFHNLAALLRPRGRLAAQCGGAGNIAEVVRHARAVMSRAPFNAVPPPHQTYHFATAEETETRLRATGFSEIETWLEPQPAHFPETAAFAQYLHTVVLGPFLGVLPEEFHTAFVDAVVAEDARHGATLTVDYVRLNMVARR